MINLTELEKKIDECMDDETAKSLKKWLEDYLERHGATQPSVPYQCCPLCNGNGQVVADGYSTSVYQLCAVCNGARIIPMHVIK